MLNISEAVNLTHVHRVTIVCELCSAPAVLLPSAGYPMNGTALLTR